MSTKSVKIDVKLHKSIKLFALENDMLMSDVVNAILYLANKTGLEKSYGYAANVISEEVMPPYYPTDTGEEANDAVEYAMGHTQNPTPDLSPTYLRRDDGTLFLDESSVHPSYWDGELHIADYTAGKTDIKPTTGEE